MPASPVLQAALVPEPDMIAEAIRALCNYSRSGDVARVLDAPTHLYTEKLISSVPRSDSGWLEP